jgi:hypothetical protein
MTFWMLSTVSKWHLLGGIWVLGKGRSHTDSEQMSVWAAEPLEYPFWSKLRSRRWQCDQERSHAASKCPHAQFLSQNVDSLVSQIQLTTDHCDCQMSIRLHESPQVVHIFLCFWSARSSRTKFVFHTLTAIQCALCHLKTCALNRACST